MCIRDSLATDLILADAVAEVATALLSGQLEGLLADLDDNVAGMALFVGELRPKSVILEQFEENFVIE